MCRRFAAHGQCVVSIDTGSAPQVTGFIAFMMGCFHVISFMFQTVLVTCLNEAADPRSDHQWKRRSTQRVTNNLGVFIGLCGLRQAGVRQAVIIINKQTN